MAERPFTNPVLAVDIFLNELFQDIFRNDAARCHLGFRNVSQSTTDNGSPLWYIWLSDKPGAFSLAMQESNRFLSRRGSSDREIAPEHPEKPYLAIRYFPDVDEAVFDALSCHEQITRLGPQFDTSGIPTYQGRRSIPERFFTAGRLDIDINGINSDVDFRCTAPTRWNEYRIDGLTLMDEDGCPRSILDPGELDRDFPGWDLSFFLFRKIVSAFCIKTGHPPRFTGYARKPSFRYRISKEEDSKEEEIMPVVDPHIIDSAFGVSFSHSSGIPHDRQQYAILKSELISQGHRLVGIWDSPDPVPDTLSVPEWWTIYHQHFHRDPDHLYSYNSALKNN